MVRDLDAFKMWLAGCGGEVLGTLSKWEVIRVRTTEGILVAHRNKRGRQVWPAGLVLLAQQYERGEFPALATARRNRPSSRLRQRYAPLVLRDGPGCFYCDTTVPAPGEPCEYGLEPTIEHLVPVMFGGPNHLANCFLAHEKCNRRAGALSAVEKIKLREAMRAQRGRNDATAR